MIDYNTAIVVTSASLLGISSGAIGVFLILRKRALVSDAISHATLPGICVAYIVMQVLFGAGKFFPGLIMGAFISGLAGMACMLLIRNTTLLKEDTAIGIVLSVFFGFGAVLLGIIQKMRSGHAAGLESFIYGKTASMIAADALLIGGASITILIGVVLLAKEFSLLCFDQDFAAAEGYRVPLFDAIMLGLTILLTVVGLQAVGLILMIALLILPAAAARFWTHRLGRMILLSALFGGVSGCGGALISSLAPNLPAGALIVVCAGAIFTFGALFGGDRGMVTEGVRNLRYTLDLSLHRLLAIMQYRLDLRASISIESADRADIQEENLPTVDLDWLRARGYWNTLQTLAILALARMRGLLRLIDEDTYRLTTPGLIALLRAARNHELQHLYVRSYPDRAQGMHSYEEQYIEGWLPAEIIEPLKRELAISKPHLFNRAAERLITSAMAASGR